MHNYLAEFGFVPRENEDAPISNNVKGKGETEGWHVIAKRSAA